MWTLPSLLTRWSTSCFAWQIEQVLAVVGRALLAATADARVHSAALSRFASSSIFASRV